MRLLLKLIAIVLCGSAARAGGLTIFAAASLEGPLDRAVILWEAQSGSDARMVYGGSSTLARQIAEGAPADIFVSASEDWMDDLEDRSLLAAESRRDLLTNRLVLVAAPGVPVPVAFDQSLPAALGSDGRLAMALVDSVPAGQYGKAALEAAGLWPLVADEVVQADNVRGALALVARGEAQFGLVYLTDQIAEPKVQFAGAVPETLHSPIRYPVAILADAPAADLAADLLDFLAGPEAAAVFAEAGFGLPD